MKKRAEGERPKRKAVRLLRRGAPLTAAFFLAVGTAFLAVPAEKTDVLCIVTGIVLAAAALYTIVSAFFGGASVLRIACGAVLASFAVWLFVQPGEAGSVLCYAVAGLLCLRALVGLFSLIFEKDRGGLLRKIAFAGDLLLVVGAMLALFLPASSGRVKVVLLGLLCCADALLECVALVRRFFARRREKKEAASKAAPRKDKGGGLPKDKALTPEREESVPPEAAAQTGTRADTQTDAQADEKTDAQTDEKTDAQADAAPPEEGEEEAGTGRSIFRRRTKKKNRPQRP